MAIALDQKVNIVTKFGSSRGISFPSLPPAGCAVFVFQTSRVYGSSATTGCSDNQGNTYSKIATVTGFRATDAEIVDIWCCPSIGSPSGTFTVTVTTSTTCDITVAIASFTGCATSDIVRYTGTDYRASVTSTDANKTSDSSPVSGDLVLAFAALDSNEIDIGSCSSGYTNIGNSGSGNAGYGVHSSNYKIVGSGGAQSASWSHTDAKWGVCLVAIKPLPSVVYNTICVFIET